MIKSTSGNLLHAEADALVNTVNTVGVMGKGIALQFKKAYPAMFDDYARAVRDGDVSIGRMHIWPTEHMTGPRYIINFPTKKHWRGSSRLSEIRAGLVDLTRVVRELEISSIAIPPLGCGNGGLSWSEVEPEIRVAFEALPEVGVLLFPPAGAPRASDMPTATKTPEMTIGRAAFVDILDRYTQQTMMPPTLIESHKLMYFLQIAGESLRLNFQAHHYGPYADNLRHVLTAIEGHYLSGYGDGSARVEEAEPLTVMPGAAAAATSVLEHQPHTRERIQHVLELSEGFESPYGLELLATVHWVATHLPEPAPEHTITQRVSEWSPRKARMFTPEHVSTALEALRAHGWLHPVRESLARTS
ncbi:type II toxin-antitoxin system antitoxin DNA ADP-ribosyl glycohydrolase DarG [Aeromicrobium piscarium]|uniref:Macro domain-containing protein n=1 Tax=Aeromicrobium piscarium TaxID=2590901 RepID=A0A554RX65_9ACTN|nr:macro domain-containing protein [Aeromicrobium piscarium]TSD58686.1 macro domain-containing protein [Aeromicrobium piscarium]